jgi:molybdopterin converting factor small subunit
VKVSVRLFASLRERLPDASRGRATLELEDGASVADLLARLGIPRVQAQMVLVNGTQAPRGHAERAALRLAPGDTVAIFPPLAGG